ncbi:MAG: hypothetical protein FIA89_04735 [Geobacter sp.]|nr:hypothetical protein [Geobacter sp.]
MVTTAPSSTDKDPIPQLRVVYCGEVRESAPRYTTPQQVAAFMYGDLRPLDREAFYVLHLNGKNQIIAKELVSLGSLSQAIVHPREVFKGALINNAAAIVAIHNHPSGNPRPSKEDKIITDRLKKSGEILGIRFLDHIIIGYTDEGPKYYSFLEGVPNAGISCTAAHQAPVDVKSCRAPYEEQNRWLAPLRKQVGLTQKRLADMAGLPHQANISVIERGWKEIDSKLEKKLRAILEEIVPQAQQQNSDAFLSEWCRLKKENKPGTILFFKNKNRQGGSCYTTFYDDAALLKRSLRSAGISFCIDADFRDTSCVIDDDSTFNTVSQTLVMAGYSLAICERI